MNYKIINTTPIEGLRIVMANNQYGVIDQNDNFVCDIVYDEIHLPDWLNSKYKKDIFVKKNGKWTSIDRTGNISIGLEVDYFSDYFKTSEKYATVKLDGNQHIIDLYGNFVTSHIFYNKKVEIELFDDHFAFILKQKNKGKVKKEIYAWNIDTQSTPDFWRTIANTFWIDYIDSDDNLDVENGNLIFQTMWKEYIINPEGQILSVNNLSGKQKFWNTLCWGFQSIMKDD